MNFSTTTTTSTSDLDDLLEARVDQAGVAAANAVREVARLSGCSLQDALEAVTAELGLL